MAQQLKRWESPRRPGRNDKGRGGSARQRQLRKRRQELRRRLSRGTPPSVHPDIPFDHDSDNIRESKGSPFLWLPNARVAPIRLENLRKQLL